MAEVQPAESKKSGCFGTFVLMLIAFAAGFVVSNEELRKRVVEVVTAQFGGRTSAEYEGTAKPGEVEKSDEKPQSSDEVTFQFVPSSRYALDCTLREYLQQNDRDYLQITASYRRNNSENWRQMVDVPLDFCSFPVVERETATGTKIYMYMEGVEIELPVTFKFESNSYREQNYLYRWYATVGVNKPGVYRVEYQRFSKRSALRKPETREELALAEKYKSLRNYIEDLHTLQLEHIRDYGRQNSKYTELLQRGREEKEELEHILYSRQIKVP